jgi:hypothetical protein
MEEMIQITRTLLDKNARGISLTENEVETARKYFTDEYILNMRWAQLPEELENTSCFRTEKQMYSLDEPAFVHPADAESSETISIEP